METYYQQLKKVVERQLTQYKEDLTVHDRNSLKGYKGEFVYGYRATGTDLFKITPYIEALREVEQTGKSDYFTDKGMREIFSGEMRVKSSYSAMAVMYNGRNKWFIHGNNGKIQKVTFTAIAAIIEKYDNHAQQIINRIIQKRKAA